MNDKNYYEILGVSLNASQDEIRRAYLKKIKEFHPDTYMGDMKRAEEMTASLNLAYGTLKDEHKKSQYDRQNGLNRQRSFDKKYQQKEEKVKKAEMNEKKSQQKKEEKKKKKEKRKKVNEKKKKVIM